MFPCLLDSAAKEFLPTTQDPEVNMMSSKENQNPPIKGLRKEPRHSPHWLAIHWLQFTTGCPSPTYSLYVAFWNNLDHWLPFAKEPCPKTCEEPGIETIVHAAGVLQDGLLLPNLPKAPIHYTCTASLCHVFTRMRSEGFSFNSWGSGGRVLFATRCFYVRNRPQPFATVRNRSQPSAVGR